MGSLILAIIGLIFTLTYSIMMAKKYKGSGWFIYVIAMSSMLFGVTIYDYSNSSKSTNPKATEVRKDKVTLKTDSIIVFLK